MYGFGYSLQWVFIYFESDFDLIRYFNFIYIIFKKSDFNYYPQTYKNEYIYSPSGVLDQIESLEPKLQLTDVLFQKNQEKNKLYEWVNQSLHPTSLWDKYDPIFDESVINIDVYSYEQMVLEFDPQNIDIELEIFDDTSLLLREIK